MAWHILAGLAQCMGWPAPSSPDDEFPPANAETDLLFVLQLTPELAETLALYDRVCFIDAHTGSVPNDVNLIEVDSEFQASPFTHHMTPQTCLSFTETLYAQRPQAILVSVRGYEFGFSRTLSPHTAGLVEQAVEIIEKWLEVHN